MYGVSLVRKTLLWMLQRPPGPGQIVRASAFIWGHKGMGKTQMQRYVAAAVQGSFISFNMATVESPGDLWGLPVEKKVKTNGEYETVTGYARPEWLPEDPNSVGILHLDEPNRANRLVRQVLTDVILSHRIGLHPLPKKWLIVCTANPSASDQYDVDELDSAIMDRFVHIPFTPAPGEVKTWLAKRGLDRALVHLLDQHEEYLGIEPIAMPTVTPSPRSWELFMLLCGKGMPTGVLPVLAKGVFGELIGGQVVEAMATSRNTGVTAMDVIQGYAKVQPQIMVWASRRFANFGALAAVVERVADWITRQGVKSLSIKERKNVQRFFMDLPTEMREVGGLSSLLRAGRLL